MIKKLSEAIALARMALAICGALFLGESFAATYYASPTGSGTTCSEASPCSLSYTIGTKVVAGDTAVLLPGTYTSGISLNSGAKHSNLTVTTTEAVKTALGTFIRGIPSGTDNRPYLQNATVTVANNVTGAVVEYLRVRGSSNPVDSCYAGVVEVSEYPFTLRYTEVWNGCQGVMIRTSRQVLVQHVYSHDHGPIPSSYDEMCVLIVNWQADAASTSYATAVQIDNSTLARCSGDGMQENSYSETGNQFSYLILSNNDVYDNEEQGYDFKGTDYVKFYGNNIYGNGYGGIGNNSAYGSTIGFEIYGNWIHDHPSYAVFNQGGGSNWSFFNNVIFNNVTNPEYNYFAVNLPGGTGAPIYGNTFYNNTDTSGTNQTGALETSSAGALVYNNIFYNNGIGAGDYGAIYSGSTITASYNYFYPASQVRGTNTVTTCYVAGNCAGFADIASDNFALLSGSPVIGRGTTLASPYNVDIIGVTRSIPFDLGAYEYEASDVTQPSVNISTADPSAISTDSLTVAGSASDAVGVSGCKWRIGSAPNGSNGTACTGTTSFSCATSGYAIGANTLYVGCYDAAGNYGSDSITVNYTDVILSAPSNLRILN